ncbi:hypothetical protein BDD12DRAFT_915806 [Trichophaea hybrida]|nr:hypothetical protein BDD12DRAFT_915806 [Trichophaea hybrida]
MASSATSLLSSWFPWTSTPLIVAAPMRTVSGSALAAAVSNANALGFFGAGAWRRFNPPFGIGFLIFKASLAVALEATKTYRPAAVWFFAQADSEQLKEWVQAFRDAAPWTKIFVQISSMGEAQELLELGVDAIVAQGVADSGGHGRKAGGSILTFVPEVKDLIRKMGKVVPVLAAGGISDGRGAAAALALGADGVVLGTRLVASVESDAPENFKQLLVDTGDGGVSTVRTRVYDDLRGTGRWWPQQYDGRVIINDSFRDHQSGMDEETNLELHQTALKGNDFSRLTAFSGTGVGLIREVLPAGEIVQSVRQDARDILLQRAREFLE